MTKQEANEWLKSVKGKKIKWNTGDKGNYIIPTGEWEATFNKNPCYWTFWYINKKGRKDWWRVYNGFKESKYNGNWELIETFEDYLEMYHND